MPEHDPSDPAASPLATPTPTPSLNGIAPPGAPRPRRLVYESTLLPARKHRRVSRWIVVPGLLLGLGAILYALLAAPHTRRFVATAGQIAFASDQGTPGRSHLWASSADGKGARPLAQGTGTDSAPAWSADGAQIAFLSNRTGSQPQVFVTDADGQNVVEVTHNAGAKSQPAFAPSDPNLIGYLAGGALSATDAATSSTVRLLPPPPDANRPQGDEATGASSLPVVITSWAWQPAQERAAQGVAAVEDNGSMEALVLLPSLSAAPTDTQTGQPDGAPLAAADALSLAWSPDGGILAVAMLGLKGLPPGKGASALVLLDAQEHALSQRPLALTPHADTGPQNPVFSPDGTQIAFELWSQPDLAHRRTLGLFVVSSDGSAPPHPVFQGAAGGARFTSDGQSLLFLRERAGGGHDLCRVNLDGSSLLRLSDGKADVTAVAVSPQKPGAHS